MPLLSTDFPLQLRWANATLNSPCVIENTPYIVYGASGEAIDIVSRSVHSQVHSCSLIAPHPLYDRGNCKLDLYCDTVQKVCLSSKSVGDSCSADKQYVCVFSQQLENIDFDARCESLNCMSNGVCGISASTPRKFGAWVYVLVAFAIIGGECDQVAHRPSPSWNE